MNWKLFTFKGWCFYINSGEDSRPHQTKGPHVHARKGGKVVYVYFSDDSVELSEKTKQRGLKLHGNEMRNIQKGFHQNKKACKARWQKQYPGLPI